jgi:hypothetical protein
MPRANKPGTATCARDERGKLLPLSAIERFAGKCAFDPVTGCVMWIGTTTHGKGRNEPYGYFWFDGRMVLAHRWAGVHIHGLDLDGLEADHCCPAGPSTLCVQHVRPRESVVNRARQHDAPSRPVQALKTKQYWLFVQLGIEPYEPKPRETDGVPFFDPPEWLAPFLPKLEANDDCPF